MSALNTAIGVGFGIFAEFFGSSGNIQIKYSHILEEAKPMSSQIPLFKRIRFRIAMILYAFNGICNLISCIFASLNVLAPTSSFTIVLNAALAHFYFGEKLTKLGYFSSLLIMIGSTISVIYGHNESKTAFELSELTALVMSGSSIFFALTHWLVITCCILVAKALSKQYELETRIIFDDHGTPSTPDPSDQLSQSDVDNEDAMERIRSLTNKLCQGTHTQYVMRAFCYSFAVGSIASWVQFFGKAVGLLISESFGGDQQFNKLGSWLYILFALWFIYWMMILLSEMMRLFEAVLIVPLYETFIIFNMILLDAVYFERGDDSNPQSLNEKAWFWVGILICIIGMFILTKAQNDMSTYQTRAGHIQSMDHPKFLFEEVDAEEDIPLIGKEDRTGITDYNSTGKQFYDVV
eukprot:214565_1